MEELHSNIDDFYKDLIVKALSDKSSFEETQLLKKWIEQDPDNKIYLNQMKSAWQVSSSIQPLARFDVESAWQKAKAIIEEEEDVDQVDSRFDFAFLARIAAMLIFAFMLGGLATYFGFKKAINQGSIVQNSVNEISAPLGSKTRLVLPDGTKVWLNAGSKLRYLQSYNTDHRDVYLEGEAFFKVQTNPKKPFIVKTSEMSVKAFGTAFNVKAYPDEATITTTLVEGIVKIEGTDRNSKKFNVSLKPKQNLVYVKKSFAENIASIKTEAAKQNVATESEAKNTIKDKSKHESIPVSVDSDIKTTIYTSWKDDKWTIEREELDQLAVMLERRYNVNFIFRSDVLKKYRISGIIRKETLEQVLDLLKLTVPMTYKIKEGIVTIDFDKERSVNYLKIMQY
jgi:ferric-dicitrate binding protein FerR (iron transport regulator)